MLAWNAIGKASSISFILELRHWEQSLAHQDNRSQKSLNTWDAPHTVLSILWIPLFNPHSSTLKVFVSFPFYFVYLFFKVFVYFWERETEHERGRGREGDRNTKQAPGSELSAQSPTWGPNPWTVRSWPEPKVRRSTNRATQVPHIVPTLYVRRLGCRGVNY